MLLYFLINKRDRVRHKILMYLYNKQESLPDKNIDKAYANHWRIAKDINETRQDIIDYHELLIDNKHVTCDNISNRNLHEISLTLDGRTAALEKTYFVLAP